MPRTPSLPAPYPLFPAGGAEAFVTDCLWGRARVYTPDRPDDAVRARQSLALLTGRARVAVMLWALPEMTPKALPAELRFPEGAHPFRVDAHLVELERQGRLSDPEAAECWRQSVGGMAEDQWTARSAPGSNIRLLSLLREFLHIGPVLTREAHEAEVSNTPPMAPLPGMRRLVTTLSRTITDAEALRREELTREGDPSAPQLRSHLLKQAVVAAFTAHERGDPVPGGELTHGDLLMLATHPEVQVRQLGLVLGATRGERRGARTR